MIEAANRRNRRRWLLLAAGGVAVAVGLTLGLRLAGPGSVHWAGAAGGRWVPRGVTEIDISDPPVRVTDPSQVKVIVASLNALDQDRGRNVVCHLVQYMRLAFTFRAASGATLATASSIPGPAGYCDPIRFKARAKWWVSLIDRSIRNPFIGRVQRVLGDKLKGNYNAWNGN